MLLFKTRGGHVAEQHFVLLNFHVSFFSLDKRRPIKRRRWSYKFACDRNRKLLPVSWHWLCPDSESAGLEVAKQSLSKHTKQRRSTGTATLTSVDFQYASLVD